MFSQNNVKKKVYDFSLVERISFPFLLVSFSYQNSLILNVCKTEFQMQSTYLNFVTDLIIDCFCKDFFFPHQKKSYFYLCGKHSKTNPCWEKKRPFNLGAGIEGVRDGGAAAAAGAGRRRASSRLRRLHLGHFF